MKSYFLIGLASTLFFASPKAHATSGDEFGTSVVAGDFDCDGMDDLAIGEPGQAVGSKAAAGVVHILYTNTSNPNNPFDRDDTETWHQGSTNIEGAPESGDRFGEVLAAGDFNDDGCDDLAIGVPYEAIGDLANAGAVNVIYGEPGGLHWTGDQIFHQDSTGIGNSAQANDYFGWALSVGDFDGDGRDDLAIGAPGEDRNGTTNSGLVHVLYGRGSNGLSANSEERWHQDVDGIGEESEDGDYFGMALAAGDFDRDGRDDLVIGVPYETVGSLAKAGKVHVIYGTYTGLDAAGSQVWHQNSSNIEGGAEANDLFGRSLAVGNFNGDDYDDLAIGVPGEWIGSIPDAGAVNVIYGAGSNGLSSSGDQIWHQDSADIAGKCEAYDYFGWTLSAGDYDDDGFDDLAIGVPQESIGSDSVAGLVQILPGTVNRLDNWGDRAIDGSQPFQFFGDALASGDFNGDLRIDLAIGAPREDDENAYPTSGDEGAVHVYRGTDEGNGLVTNSRNKIHAFTGVINL